MVYSVAVAGASGYAGGEVLRLLTQHPEFTIGAVTAHSRAGTLLGEHHPHLRVLAQRELLATTPETLAGHDIVILALPHGASGNIAAQLPQSTLVVDLGADHRLENADDWKKYYGTEHAGTWTYGMPELLTTYKNTSDKQREALIGATRIAVPGCNVTAVTLGLQPAVNAGLIDTATLNAVLAVGYSGAGKSLQPHLLASEGLGTATPYAVGGTHRHIPEIKQNLIRAGATECALSFTPVLVPMSRGILATMTAAPQNLDSEFTHQELNELWSAAYDNEPFVEVLPQGTWPTTKATLGANTAHIQVTFDQTAQKIVVITALDNLVKGTAGAAIQSINIALGLPETLGLTTQGIAP